MGKKGPKGMFHKHMFADLPLVCGEEGTTRRTFELCHLKGHGLGRVTVWAQALLPMPSVWSPRSMEQHNSLTPEHCKNQ